MKLLPIVLVGRHNGTAGAEKQYEEASKIKNSITESSI